MNTFEQFTETNSNISAIPELTSDPLTSSVDQQSVDLALETHSSEVSIIPLNENNILPIEAIDDAVIPVKSLNSTYAGGGEQSLTGQTNDELLVGSSESLDLGATEIRDSVQFLDESASKSDTLPSSQSESSPQSFPNSALIQPTYRSTDDNHQHELDQINLKPSETIEIETAEETSPYEIISISELKKQDTAIIETAVATTSAPITIPTTSIQLADLAGDILTVPNSIGSVVPLKFRWTEREAAFNNEVGVFVVDDFGRVNGVAPDHPDYAYAALTSASKQIIFTSGQGAGAQKQLEFTANDKLAFYLIQNNSSSNWLNQNPKNQVGQGSIAFFSLNQANPDQFDHLQSRLLSDGIVELRWEDLTGGGDRDFDDVVFTIAEPGGTTPEDGPALVIPGLSGQRVGTKFVWVFREAAFNNEMGIFYVDDAQGRIGNLLPGEPGYALAALTRQGSQVIFSSGETAGATEEIELSSQKYVGFYLIQNNTTAAFLQQNPQNQIGKGPLAFFFFPEANPDGIVHIQQRSNNEFAWEDLTGGGDRDFDDLIFRYEFGTPTGGIQPQLSISDVSIVEGDRGTKAAEFVVNLSQPSNQAITVKFATESGTATSGVDFQPVSGMLTFAPGETTQIITVPIVGDQIDEADETFTTQLNTPTNATIADAQGIGTIIDNDDEDPVIPTLAIGDIEVLEGQEGITEAIFTVTLSDATAETVTVDFTTKDGTAIVNQDYQLTRGTLTFQPGGSLSQTIRVPILGDRITESNETFSVQLQQPNNATLADEVGLGTILNDDQGQVLDVTLQEGTSFQVAYRQSFTVPQESSVLKFSFEDLVFDTTDPDSINDAFEARLVDANGNSLVYTLGKGQDTFLNITEGLSTQLAPGVTLDGKTVSLNLAGLTPGSTANLVLQLVNNDGDTTTSVRITNFEITPAGAATPPTGVIPITNTSPNNSFAVLLPEEFAALRLQDVSASFTADYERTSFNEDTKVLYTNLSVKNSGTYAVDTPLYMVVDRLTDPSVQVLNADGITPEGLPYYDISRLVADGNLAPSEASTSKSIAFYNPNNVQFDYQLSFLGQLNQAVLTNQAPQFTSAAVVDALVGQPYTYDANAIDPDNDALTYSLKVGPQTMQVDAITGAVTWTPMADDLGSQTVIVLVEDGKGGQAEQRFTITTRQPLDNRTPAITSTAITTASISQPYTYNVDAIDPDGDPLTYSLLSAPQGMVIDGSSGVISWETAAQTPGNYDVTVQAADGRGGVSTQAFTIGLTNVATGEIRGTVWDDLNANGVRDLQIGQRGDSYVDVVLEYFANGASPTQVPEPYGSNGGVPPATPENNAGKYTVEPVNPNVVLGAPPPNPILPRVNSQVDWLALPQGSYVTLGFSDETVIDGPGDDIFIRSFDPADSAGESADVFVSSNGTDFTFLGRVRQLGVQSLDLSSIGFTDPVKAVRIVGVDNLGTSPGFDLVNVEVLPNSIGSIPEPGQSNVQIYLDINNNGVLDPDEPSQLTSSGSSTSSTTTSLTVQGTDVIYLSGRTDVTIPLLGASDPSFSLIRHGYVNPDFIQETKPQSVAAQAGDIFTFAATGSVDFFNGSFQPTGSSDGYAGTSTSNLFNLGGIGAYRGPQGALVGVFLTDENPASGAVTGAIDYSTIGSAFETISPGLGQIFFIGDGLTGRGTGDTQEFVAPNGATRLFLGIADAAGVSDGPPGFYEDNDGAYQVTINRQTGQQGTGDYRFTNLQPGTYIVREVIPNGYRQTFPGGTTNSIGDGFADAILDYFDSGAGPIPGPYGWNDDSDFSPVPVNPTVTLNSDQNGALSLPTGSSVTVAFTNEVIVDGPGDDIFVLESGAAGERAEVYVSSNLRDFVLLGIGNGGSTSLFDLASIGFTEPVRGIKIVGLDNGGSFPGFDVVNVQGLPGSIASPDFYTVMLGAGEIADNRNFGNTLVNVGPNRDPSFISTAPTIAAVGIPFRYDAKATDRDGNSLSYDLLTSPTGMVVDSARGVVIWQPGPDQSGVQDVVLRVRDGQGGSALQSFKITVGENQAPNVTSDPITFAKLGELYSYQVTGTDPEGQPLSFQLINAPQGMTIDAQTGLVQWSPTATQTGNFSVTVAVQDQAGAIGRQTFTLTAADNATPIINSTAPTTTTAGLTYRYDVKAVDPDGDTLSYSLINAPQGMTIDALGRLSWVTSAANVGVTPIELRVTDTDGASVSQLFDLTVAPDLQAPKVNVQLSSGTIEIGKTVTFQVSATDNVKVNPENVTLTVNGSPITLAGGRNATFQPTQAGLYEVVATVKDAAGNLTTTDPITLRVIDPKDTNAPEITIISPSTNTQVTTLTDIIGSVVDTDLEFYRVEYAPFSQVDFNNLRLADPDFVTITQNSTVVTNGTLAQFDPTLLLNDDYVIRITARDVNGNTNTQGLILGVTSDNKLGNFRIELTDLSIPLGGIPITVDRVYDTLQRNQSSDFGYGWSLGEQDARIQESVPVSELEQLGIGLFGGSAFNAGTRVYLTNPEGQRVGFTFDPVVVGGSFFGELWAPRFTPDAGVFDTLTDATDNIRLVRASDGTFRYPLFSFLTYNPTDYNLTTKAGLTYRYDQFEGLEEIRDRNGNTVSFTDAGITSSTGASVQFARDPQGRITQIIDPAGNAIQYGYDAKGDLVKVTDQAGLSTIHTYVSNQPHYLEQIIDPRGKAVIKTEYDEKGRVKSTTDALGRSLNTTYEINALNSTESKIDSLGNSTTTVRDERGNITSVTNPIGAVRTFAYDENNNQISETDPRGFTLNRTYDARGNITSITEPLGVKNTFTYDQFNNITTTTDALGRIITYVYDEKGNLKELIDAAGGTGQFTVDEFGRITSVTDPKGNKTTYVFDSPFSASINLNKPTQIIFADGSSKKFEYNQFGQVKRATDENGHVTEFITDSIGRLLIERDHLGNETTYTYDAQNLTSVTDPLGNTTRFEYNDAGQITRQIDPVGSITSYSYDVLGRLVSEIDPLGRVTTRSYCSCGSLSSVADAAGNTISFEYDLAGNLTGIVDPLGQKTSFVYDALGRQTKQIDPLGYEKSFVYDDADNLIEIVNRNGQVSQFSYDRLNQLVQETWRDNSTITREINLSYDAVGNLISVQDEASSYTFDYDNRNRVIQTNTTSTSGVTPTTFSYTYNGVGQTTSVKDNLGVEVRSAYDPLNRVVNQTWQGTGIDAARVDMTYDAGGNLIQVNRFSDLAGTQLVNTTTQTYEPIQTNSTLRVRSYNARGDVDQVQEFFTLLNPRSLSVENTSDAALQIDNDYVERITQITNTDALGNITSSYSSDYDLVGQLIQEVHSGQTNMYTYDLNGQLIQAERTSFADEAYTYDANGNRTSNGYVIGNNNQVLSDGVFNYNYDAEGNLTEKISIATNEVVKYSYNHRNQLISVTTQDANSQTAQVVEYLYDIFDRRIAENINGRITYFVYDGENLWSELDESSNVIVQYFSEDKLDGLMARYRSGEGTAWYLKDRLGTVRDIVDSQGQLLNHIEYSSFGQILSQTNLDAGDQFGFTGREYSTETGLYYYRARYYDPVLGRFINQDPTGFEAGDSNLYRYVGNSPLNAVDPTGLVSLSEYRALASSIAQTVQKCIARTVGASVVQNILESGVYLFLTQDGKWYVGQTNNFERRLGEHKAKKYISDTIQKISFPAKDKDALRKVEQYLYEVVEYAFGSQDKLNKIRPQSPKKPKLDC